jgi:hypothetical protein
MVVDVDHVGAKLKKNGEILVPIWNYFVSLPSLFTCLLYNKNLKRHELQD